MDETDNAILDEKQLAETLIDEYRKLPTAIHKSVIRHGLADLIDHARELNRKPHRREDGEREKTT